MEEGLISAGSLEKIREKEKPGPTSLHWEWRSLLYLGIILFLTGTGIIIYTHLQQFGYFVIIGTLILLISLSYTYCFFVKPPFSWSAMASPNIWYDYSLLAGGSLLVLLAAYLQSQFNFFGSSWNLDLFVPMVMLFFTAYYYDHRGILGMAILSLAAWLGITINNATAFGLNLLNEPDVIRTLFLLGCGLIALSVVIGQNRFKPHFQEIFHQFGIHFAGVAAVAGVINESKYYLIWLAILLVLAMYLMRTAFRKKSTYYLVAACLYPYAGLTYIFMENWTKSLHGEPRIYANLGYAVISGLILIGVIYRLNKKITQS
ncbi:hypothetical protein FPE01S_04_05130 [Flavihumibacter petaseus NBRC 106054]|uniref:DUF2157 domain-containing protein n=2 Tax=Flavihumibacter TaxID=1004301 RepID=A0A0E9N614_9BACT|nr:hypothetical protein FPE01S_04_05130 [Flavihumibacter petaseus NBRC 106054]